MEQRITIPDDWHVPASIRARVADVPGTQRCLEADGHLILILHKLPAAVGAERFLRLFWRSPDSTWASDDLGVGINALQRHVTEYNDRVLTLEKEEDGATSAEEYFQIRGEVAPVYRAAKNMSAAISRGYELFGDDRGLLACRNLAATVERTAELLKEESTYGIEYFTAKHAESQALAAHRLNLIAAIFFPILAVASVFGMNLDHGFENMHPAVFWGVLAAGIGIGLVLKTLVFRTNKGSR